MNNRLDNLRYDTPSNNHQDKYRHGTMMQGEKHYNAKLTTDDVRQIRELVCQGTTQRELARQFNVCEATVSLLVHNKTWGRTA
jgi:DNA-binding NarL/FixJ family response regulator